MRAKMVERAHAIALVLLFSSVAVWIPGLDGAHEACITKTLADALSPSRGNLVLAPSETINLTGRHEYARAILGDGSTLILWECDLVLGGDGIEPPSMTGSAEGLSLYRSSLRILGPNSTKMSRDRGEGASFDLRLSGGMSVVGSAIEVRGGRGYTTMERGAYCSDDIGGRRFCGGNATFSLTMDGPGPLTFLDGKFIVLGGDGGDAPDGELLTLGSAMRPGGYTQGGNVSDLVGSGGHACAVIDAPMGHLEVAGTKVVVGGGRGADAGAAGNVRAPLEIGNTTSIPGGGYTSGCERTDPGRVQGNVGSGGDSTLRINVSSARILSDVTVRGGRGGNGGNGSNCRSTDLMTYPLHTDGGGGGAGYAGGHGGMEGGRGGDVSGSVGRGGDACLEIFALNDLTMSTMDMRVEGGPGGKPGSGGLGGGIFKGVPVYDGGGAGGGGYSGGGGGSASPPARGGRAIGGSPGSVGEDVGAGGDSSMVLRARHLMADDVSTWTNAAGPGNTMPPRLPESGEVGAESLIGGLPGGQDPGIAKSGRASTSTPPPAPVPKAPADGGRFRTGQVHFEWTTPMECFWGAEDVHCDWRLLSSPDPGSTIRSVTTSSSELDLAEDPGDGHYYWAVRAWSSEHVSCWSMPRSLFIDRSPPVPAEPFSQWVPAFDPRARFDVRDPVSGVDPATCDVRVDPASGPIGDWERAAVMGGLDGVYTVIAQLRSGADPFSIYLRCADRAGNGPIVGGPYTVRIDAVPPKASSPVPSGWIVGPPSFGFNATDSESGISPLSRIEVKDPGGDIARTFDDVRMVARGPNRFIAETNISVLPGYYRYYITVSDRAGNSVRLEGEVGIDAQSPYIAIEHPAEGMWVNDPTPCINGTASDQLSGVGTVEAIVHDAQGAEMDKGSAVLGSDGSFSFTPSSGLADGSYSVTVSCTDRAGNVLTTGRRCFGIDSGRPMIGITNVDHVPFNEKAEVEYACGDGVSGIKEVLFQRMASEGGVWKAVANYSAKVPGSGGTMRMALPIPGEGSPIYWRMSAEDRAGNRAATDPVMRCDRGPIPWSVDPVSPPVLGPGIASVVSVRDALGIDPGSIECTIGGKAAHFDHEVVERDLDHGSIEALRLYILPPPGASGEAEIGISWMDPLPLSPVRNARTPIFIDDQGPFFVISAPEAFGDQEVPVPILGASDASLFNGSSFSVKVGEGDWASVGSEGGPSWIGWDGAQGTLVVNVTWGPPRTLQVMAEDEWGNRRVLNSTVRATRPPTASIEGIPGDRTIRTAGGLRLTASYSDPEGDPISVRWYVDGIASGSEGSVVLKLPEGVHEVELVVSDGFHNASVTSAVTVAYGGIGTGALIIACIVGGALLMAVIVASLLLYRSSSRGKGGSEVADKPRSKGRAVIVEDPEDQSDRAGGPAAGGVRCSICMRAVLRGVTPLKCRCGSAFHRGCARNEGVCPGCGREILIPRG